MKKENKRKFNIFVSILTCFIITLACLSPSFISSADGNPRLVDLYDVSSSVISNDETDFPFLKSDNSNYTVITDFYNSTYNDTGFSLPSSALRDVESCPHYVLICESSEDWKFILLPENTFLVGNTNGYAIYVPVENDNVSVLLYGYLFDHYNTWQQTYLGYRNTQHWGPSRNATIDGDKYYKMWFSSDTSAWGPVLSSDVPCYASDTLDITSLNGLDNVNSSIASEDSSLGTAENNLYFDNFDINYAVSNMNNGNIVCYGKLNDYQLQHMDEFALAYSISFDVDVSNNWIGGKNYSFVKNYSYQQELSDFYNHSESKSFQLKDIEQSIPFQADELGLEIDSLYDFLELERTGSATGTETFDLGKVQWRTCRVTTSVNLVKKGSISDLLSTRAYSGSFSESYNFLNGLQANQSRGILSNNNPVQSSNSSSIESENDVLLNDSKNHVSSDKLPFGNGGGNSSANNNSTTNSGNITINNNYNPSGSGGSNGTNDSSVSNFFLTFNPVNTFFTKLVGDNQSTAEDLTENVGINNWFTIINETYSWIPPTIWSTLLTCFVTCMGIVIIAFIIRIILDLL